MRYITEESATRNRVNLEAVGSIHRTGSVRGMQERYGWAKGGQVRVGSYIYNIGVSEVDRLRNLGALRGDGR